MTIGRIPSVEGGIQPTIVDAKGDLIVATAADTVNRLAVGSNDQVLTADSSTATGLKWATVSSGGLTLINETVANAVSSITFSGISGYKQLLLTWHGIYHSNTGNFYAVRLNNNTNNIYGTKRINFSNTSITNDNDLTNNHFYIGSTYLFGSECNQTTAYEKMVKGQMLIDNADSTTKAKYVSGFAGYQQIDNSTNLWSNFHSTFYSTSAISSIEIVRIAGTGTISNYTNTSIRLYGVN